jgi:hypothetical protein
MLRSITTLRPDLEIKLTDSVALYDSVTANRHTVLCRSRIQFRIVFNNDIQICIKSINV